MSEQVPEGWTLRSIASGIDILSGFPFKSEHFSTEPSHTGLIRIRDLVNQELETFYGGEFEDQFLVTKGDILIGMDGDFTIVKWKTEDALLNQRICKIDVSENSDLHLDYLFHDLKDELLRIHEKTGSTTVKHLSVKDIRGIEKAFPPLPEQKKIASILTSVDEVIEKTQSQIDKLQDLKKGTMNELLTKGIGHTEFKDSELGRIPKSWEVNRLINLTEGRFGIVDGPFGSNLKTEHYRSSGIPVIQSGFVTTGHFTPKNYVYVDEDKFQSEIRSSVKGGDIVMAKIGAQAGRCAIMPMNHPIGILAGNSLKISTKKDALLAEYLHQLLTHLYSTGEIQSLRTETAQPAISIATLKRYRIATPSIREQDQILNTLSSIDFQVVHQTRKLEQTQSLKKSLMQDLLTGKVRVSVN